MFGVTTFHDTFLLAALRKDDVHPPMVARRCFTPEFKPKDKILARSLYKSAMRALSALQIVHTECNKLLCVIVNSIHTQHANIYTH